MNAQWPLAGCQVIGGMALLANDLPFMRGRVVLQRAETPGKRLQVRRYVAPDAAAGELMSEDEWQRLCRDQQGFALDTPIAAAAGGWLWLFGPGFDALIAHGAAVRQLRERNLLLFPEPGVQQDVTLCLVEDARGQQVREGWATDAFNRGWSHVQRREWQAALRLAELSLDIGGLAPSRVGLVALAHEQLNDKDTAEGYLTMLRNSRGDAPWKQANEWLSMHRPLAQAQGAALSVTSQSGASTAHGRDQRKLLSQWPSISRVRI